MKFNWEIEQSDIQRVKSFVELHKDDYFVKMRKALNLADEKQAVSKDAFWRQLVACLLTSVQRSGPTSFVARFLRSDPFPLAYSACISHHDVEAFAKTALTGFGGIRRTNVIPHQIAINLRVLEQGLWQPILAKLGTLQVPANRVAEREAAELIRHSFKGIGPKQSRNLLQGLGLTRYEIPIDSRITGWLTKFGFPIPLSAAALADPSYYQFVMERIQELCEACDIYPCILDASIFASVDKGAWSEENYVS